MQLDLPRTALVVTDPQNDFLSPKGVAWGVVGDSVKEHHTIPNIGRLFAAAKKAGLTVAISPHYYYPTDKGWKFEGALEKLMSKIDMFARRSPTSGEQFENSGADFLPEYKPYILDGKTIVASPHKVYGPQANDLVLQLRKQRVDQVILAGMSANLCVEAHLRHLLEEGFEVAVVRDGSAAGLRSARAAAPVQGGSAVVWKAHGTERLRETIMKIQRTAPSALTGLWPIWFEQHDIRKKTIGIALSVALLAGLFGSVAAVFNTTVAAANRGADPTIIVAIRGEADGVLKTLPDFGDGRGALDAICFPDIDLVNVATGKVIGTAEDCLAEVVGGANGGLLLTGTTFFTFPGGQLVSRGRTTVQPLNEIAHGSPFTHITGAIPAPGTNQVVHGTRRFRGAEGTVRLSGTVDLSFFTGAGTPIGFDCIFEINLKDM